MERLSKAARDAMDATISSYVSTLKKNVTRLKAQLVRRDKLIAKMEAENLARETESPPPPPAIYGGLRKCPFCRAKPTALDEDGLPKVYVDNYKPNAYVVTCRICDAFGPHAATSEESVALWNESTPRHMRPSRREIPDIATAAAEIAEANRAGMLDNTSGKVAIIPDNDDRLSTPYT